MSEEKEYTVLKASKWYGRIRKWRYYRDKMETFLAQKGSGDLLRWTDPILRDSNKFKAGDDYHGTTLTQAKVEELSTNSLQILSA